MNNKTLQNFNNNSVVSIIRNTFIQNENFMSAEFLTIIQHLYKYSIFKNILDIVVTKCKYEQLKFKIEDNKLFDIDAGNCLTMVDSNTSKKSYIITIKKLASDIIMHEIGHMIEKELSHILNLQAFSSALMQDIERISGHHIYMKSIVKSLFITQVEAYKVSQHMPELFARFFQFFAGAKEVSFQSSLSSDYRLDDAIALFSHTLEVLDTQLKGDWNILIDSTIASESQQFSQSVNALNKMPWADHKIRSESKNQYNTTASRWKVKSNKDDPFK